jgi:hypothetical protein
MGVEEMNQRLQEAINRISDEVETQDYILGDDAEPDELQRITDMRIVLEAARYVLDVKPEWNAEYRLRLDVKRRK